MFCSNVWRVEEKKGVMGGKGLKTGQLILTMGLARAEDRILVQSKRVFFMLTKSLHMQ
jgi:hypothetical protein